MMVPSTFVLDASAGVKWFRPEAGQDRALELLERAEAGEIRIAVPTHFLHEVLSVVRRERGPGWVVSAWERLMETGIDVVPLTEEVVVEAAEQCAALGCSFYDALAPACATLLGATLASADARAHGSYPGVLLIV